MNLNQSQIDYLVKNASAKLGVSQEQLKKELQAGTFDRLLNTLPKQEANKITSLLSNPATAQMLLSSPQAKALMQKMFGNK